MQIIPPEISIKPQAKDALPLVSYVLICYNQQNVIEEALSSALEQTYENIEIVISDDCSTDATVETIKSFMKRRQTKYKLNVNEKNLGIGGNLSKAINLCSGEFIVPAAGDDIALSNRVELVVNHWLSSGKKIGFINTDLIEIDLQGNETAYESSDNFASYRNIEDWLKKPQFHVGAEYWSREFWNKFPPLINISGDDQVLAFRAIISGVGSTIHKATIKHRAGGISTTKITSYRQKVDKLLSDAKSSIIDLSQILEDAKLYSLDYKIASFIENKIREAELTIFVFDGRNDSKIIKKLFSSKSVKLGKRLRLFFYFKLPWLMSFIILLKQFFKK
jgi:glycosyltransferase involved in cell wall biosynthesis